MLHGICIGDTHLDKLRRLFPTDHIKLQVKAIRKALQYAYSNGLKHVFFLGDIGEGYKDFTGQLVMSEEARVALLGLIIKYDGKLNMYFYCGNHDFTEIGSNTLTSFIAMYKGGLFKTTHFYDKPVQLKLDGELVNILPYPEVKPLSKDRALNFAHYEVSGALADSGRPIKNDNDYTFNGQPFIQGHLHTPQKVGNHYYVGTLYQTTFGERLPKGFGEFKYNNGKLKYRHVQVDPPFKLINLRVYKRQDLKQLVADPNVLFKLFIDETVKVIEKDFDKYPNIVNKLSFSTEEEADALELSEFFVDNQEIELTYDSALEESLRNDGLKPKQIKEAHAILERFKKGKYAQT